MKKIKGFMAIIVMLFVVAVFLEKVSFSRITGSTPDQRDIWCAGVDGAEVCVDSSGNIIPTTDDDTDLGTSSLQFQDLYIDGVAYVDEISNDGAYAGTNGTFTGAITASSMTVTGTNGIQISTSTSSGASLTLMGAVVTLSTMPARAGLIYFQTSDLKVYISTRAAVANETTGEGTILYSAFN